MSRSFKLPDLGEGIHEGEIVSVLVGEGDTVEEGNPILEVETDKATVEIPSPYTGTVEKITCKAGDTVHVGDVLLTFGGEGEEPQTKPEASEDEVEVKKAEKKEEKPAAKEGKEAKRPEPREEKPEREEEPEEEEEKEKAAKKPEISEKEKPEPKKEGVVPASPATRKLAREMGVDLHDVPASGPEGLVTMEDVRSFADTGKKKEKEAPAAKGAEAPAAEAAKGPSGEASPLVPGGMTPPPLPDFTKWGEVERVPVRSVRRATAKQMALAWSQIPHVTTHDSVDVVMLEEFRNRHKQDVEKKGGKLSITVFVLKAVATALRAFPNFNSTLDTASGEIVLKKYYHLGVAAQTENGLMVPVIRDVDRKSILELSVELTDLVNRARDRKISPDDMKGGTFTITNIGPMGGGHFNPIINYPEVAILGMGQARLEPVVRTSAGGTPEIVIRRMMPVSLTIDHRVLDGADAVAFLGMIKSVLEDPDRLLMSMT